MIPAAVEDTQHITKPSPRTPLQSVSMVTKGEISSDWNALGHRQNQPLAHRRRQDGGAGRKNKPVIPKILTAEVKEGEQLLEEQLPDLSTTVWWQSQGGWEDTGGADNTCPSTGWVLWTGWGGHSLCPWCAKGGGHAQGYLLKPHPRYQAGACLGNLAAGSPKSARRAVSVGVKHKTEVVT